MKEFNKFIFKELVLTGSIGIIAFILFNSYLINYYINIFWAILALISVLTAVMHFSLLNIGEKNASKFATKFMTISGIKMMVYLVFITAYSILNPSEAKSFLISFIALYSIYTTFEVFHIVKHLKKKWSLISCVVKHLTLFKN